jgi:hypothetical protein
MNDDSQSDVAPARIVLDMAAGAIHPLSLQSDQELSAELKRRGYKVYPEKRVRIYAAQEMVSRRDLSRLRHIQGITDSTNHYLAMRIGKELAGSGALVKSKEDRTEETIYRAQVCVVLPNDWDFEAEMWGIR